MEYSINEEKWFNDLDRRCRDILDDALKGYPDYLWMNTYQEDYVNDWINEDGYITEVFLEFELQSGEDFGFPIHTYGLATFRFNLINMDEIPSVYGVFSRERMMMEFTIDPLYIDTMNQTLWILELDKQGWYDV